MPEIKYKTKEYSTKIEPVEVERSTDKSVWIKSKDRRSNKIFVERSLKVTDYQIFHDSWELAHTYLVSKHRTNLNVFKDKFEREQVILDLLLAMKNPEENA